MMVSKQVADALTAVRGMIALALGLLGITQGIDGLYLAGWLQLVAWITDGLDGPLARNSSRQYHSWLGDHDLQVDMMVSAGLFIYLVTANLVTPIAAVSYLLIWAAIFARWGFSRPLGMLLQAPIYGRFIWVLVQAAPEVGYFALFWIITLLVVTWPRFPRQILPEFFSGIRAQLSREPKNHDGNHGASNGLGKLN